MLSRPEIGTREHILLWLASRDPREEYVWQSHRTCARGKYCSEFYGEHANWPEYKWASPVHRLDSIAQTVSLSKTGTMGALYEAVCKAWR